MNQNKRRICSNEYISMLTLQYIALIQRQSLDSENARSEGLRRSIVTKEE